MTPAFSSNKQAACFTALLAVILLSPLICRRPCLPPRSEVYSSIPWRFGGYPYFHRTIFEQEGDLDIAFIGSSRIWSDMNPVQVRQVLSKSLGREAKVVSLGWISAGFDALYFISQDLLRNRNVRMLVVYDEYNPALGGKCPQRFASRWFRYGDNADEIADLALNVKAGYYASAVLGMPRNLLSELRKNMLAIPAPYGRFSTENLYQAKDPGNELGALCQEKNLGDPTDAFVHCLPQSDISADDVMVYSGRTRQKFNASTRQMPDLQVYFARKLAELAKLHDVTLVFLHLPAIDDVNNDKISEAAIWPEILVGDVKLLGLPSSLLFKGMDRSEIARLFCDPAHLNRNGQEYFTSLIAPKLVELYHVKMDP